MLLFRQNKEIMEGRIPYIEIVPYKEEKEVEEPTSDAMNLRGMSLIVFVIWHLFCTISS